jgi:hypothetical protein
MGGERIADGSAAAKQHVKHPGGKTSFASSPSFSAVKG